MPPPGTYWSITVGTVAALVVTILAIAAFTRGKTRTRRKVQELAARPGMAKPRDITRAVGRNALLANRSELRPTLTGKAGPSDLGWRWGQACGVDVYTSVRDSVVLLGPSGAGKGVYVVNNRVLDAPGAVVVDLHPPRRRGDHHDRPRPGRPGRGDRDRRIRRRPAGGGGLVADHRLP